ncbi:helix-turn-helix domain-containing protein [Solitalea lacus]|uniref:helix-turn-helix domain-containing protein n=1 Tax=Solitalea lacus TaxID=2911172 RepID=UPI001EDC0BC2|nr:XRE family transcriptional regulator [Solitalea lacus]UKJ06148.1 XRE family transcriptional regulator [Solitalea lacus]
MKDIIAKRIKSARTLSGLSLRELSEKMHGVVSHNAITKYEQGLMMPDSKVLLALAHALSVKPDYFFRPYTVNIENIEFRKKSKLPKKEVSAIKEKVTDSIAKYIELEQFLNISSNFINPIKNIIIKDGDDVEKAVDSLLTHWKIGFNALPNVIELLEDKEIKVIELDADENFDGLSGWANDSVPVIVINTNFSIERKRFTALHELGHLLLSFQSDLDQKLIEKLCHRFAGAMLIPKETVFHELGESRKKISLSELIAIKETYGISIQATMARARDLKIIGNDRYIQFCISVNRNENLKKEIGFGQYVGKEKSSRFKQLLYRATAEEIISMSKAANLANQKLATFRDEFIEI